MIFQLFETQALLGAITILMYVGAMALVFILLGVGFFILRRLTAPAGVIRRRVFKIFGLFFLIPGVLIPIVFIVFFVVTNLWPEPKIDKTWDFSTDTSMAQFDASECSISEDAFGIEHRCIYQGNISVSIRLPEGRHMDEKAKQVWVDGEKHQITKIMIFSVRYELDEVYSKLDEYIREWDLSPQKFQEWKQATQAGEIKPLYYWRDDGSSGTPRFWFMAKRLEEKKNKPWFLRLELYWD